MPYLIFSFLLWLWNPGSFNQISRGNLARKEAELAYRSADFPKAAAAYEFLTQTSKPDPTVRMNLGHSYFQLKQLGKASQQYTTLLTEKNEQLAATAATQLGVIACLRKDSALALSYFQQALLRDSNNEPARYNLELIQRQYSGKKPPKHSPTPHQQKQTPTPSGAQVEQSERQDEQLRRFKNLNMSEEQALQLLNAMQDSDLPYSLARRSNRSGNGKSTSRW